MWGICFQTWVLTLLLWSFYYQKMLWDTTNTLSNPCELVMSYFPSNWQTKSANYLSPSWNNCTFLKRTVESVLVLFPPYYTRDLPQMSMVTVSWKPGLKLSCTSSCTIITQLKKRMSKVNVTEKLMNFFDEEKVWSRDIWVDPLNFRAGTVLGLAEPTCAPHPIICLSTQLELLSPPPA